VVRVHRADAVAEELEAADDDAFAKVDGRAEFVDDSDAASDLETEADFDAEGDADAIAEDEDD
jgi:hypothetical protein